MANSGMYWPTYLTEPKNPLSSETFASVLAITMVSTLHGSASTP